MYLKVNTNRIFKINAFYQSFLTAPPTPVNNWCNGDSKKVVEKRTVKQTNTFRSSIFSSPSNMNNRSLSNNKKSVSSTNFSNSGCVIEDSGPVVYASNGINKLTELKGRSQCNNKVRVVLIANAGL